MFSLEQLLKIKNELIELLEDGETVEMEFVMELVESHIEAIKN